MSGVLALAAAFLSGLLASMGLGGGMILILYLTLIEGVSQRSAQGINLVFFLPIAALAMIIHCRAGLADIEKLLPAIISGCVTGAIFSFAAGRIESELLSKLFGGFVIAFGAATAYKALKKRK